MALQMPFASMTLQHSCYENRNLKQHNVVEMHVVKKNDSEKKKKRMTLKPETEPDSSSHPGQIIELP